MSSPKISVRNALQRVVVTGIALARLSGRAVLRVACAAFLAIVFGSLAAVLAGVACMLPVDVQKRILRAGEQACDLLLAALVKPGVAASPVPPAGPSLSRGPARVLPFAEANQGRGPRRSPSTKA